jgi:cytochrome c-type biogenesis protein
MDLSSALTSVSLGLLASASPCILPLYPGFLAYLSGGQDAAGRTGRYFLGLFVLAGVLTMMLALGLLIAALSISVGKVLSIVVPLADLLIIILGILLLFNRNPFKRLPQIRVPLLRSPFANAFLYGLLYGPIALPCSGPFVVSIFALSLTAAEAAGRLTTFLWFGLGFGLPLLALSLLSGATQRWITRLFARHARRVNLVGGILLISVAAYDLWINRELVVAFF